MLSRGLIISMEQLLAGVGFDIRVSATQATPLTGPPITNMAETVATLAALPEIADVVPLRIGQADVDIGRRSRNVNFMGANATVRRPWTLFEGTRHRPIAPATDNRATCLINQNLARRLELSPGSHSPFAATVQTTPACLQSVFHVNGIAEFPFDQARTADRHDQSSKTSHVRAATRRRTKPTC